MPAYNNTISCDPQTKQQWSALLDLLYQHWRYAKMPVTFCPTVYARGALRLDGVIGYRRIGSIVH